MKVDNLAGHRARYAALQGKFQGTELAERYVGGGNPHRIGYLERAILIRHGLKEGQMIVDVGCGMGRLARYLQDLQVDYLGIDIVPEILEEARTIIGRNESFRFELVKGFEIPLPDTEAHFVTMFSLATHLLDIETYSYMAEAKRVLRNGGHLILSFLDYSLPYFQEMFERLFQEQHGREDLLSFIQKDTLRFFGESLGYSVVEFIDSGSAFGEPDDGERLLDNTSAPSPFTFGQSVAVFRAH